MHTQVALVVLLGTPTALSIMAFVYVVGTSWLIYDTALRDINWLFIGKLVLFMWLLSFVFMGSILLLITLATAGM